jgi:hypothetical protein
LLILTGRASAIAGLLVLAFGGTAVTALAQSTPPAPVAAPATAQTPTPMDRAYDGRLHVTLAPYIWAPTVGGKLQYTIPNLPFRSGGGGTATSSAQVGPNDYLPKLNSAAMFSFDARKGDFDIFGDYIYVNASVSASSSTIISGPLGRIQIPVTINSNAHLRESIWEAAAGYTFARNHNADLSIFAGIREYPLNVSFDYDATVFGRRNTFTKSGSIDTGDIAQDVIFGLRGKTFLGNGSFFIPYYGDVGTNVGHLANKTWQVYSGAGYAFPHGQTILLAYRDLTFDEFDQNSHVQRFSMYGPLLGYTLNL